MIQVSDLSKVFRTYQKEAGIKGSLKSLFVRKWREIEALKQVSLKVEAGEILGLVGSNGAGKTTLIKILSGIIHPTSGEATVLGYRPFERRNDFRRQIALVMGQKAQLWWDLPAADCFLLLREIYRVPENDFRRRLDELSERLEVRGLLEIPIRRLSLGERMKMELIAALLHNPKVVFLDEPTIGLDFTAQRALRDFILEYRRRYNPIILVTSHYMQDIIELCERVAIIRAGEIVYDGKLARIIDQFARTKIITLHLSHEGNSIPHGALDSIPFEIISCDDVQIKLRVPRDKVSAEISSLMQGLPVQDLSVVEEDLSVIIESIMRHGIR